MATEAFQTTATPESTSSPDHKRKIYNLDSDEQQSHIGASDYSEVEFVNDDDKTGGSGGDDVENEDELSRGVKRPRLEQIIPNSDGDNGYINDKGEDPNEAKDAINNTEGTFEGTEHVVDTSLPKEEIGNGSKEEEIDNIQIKNEFIPMEDKQDLRQGDQIDEFLFKEEVTQCLQKDNEMETENHIAALKEKEELTEGEEKNEVVSSRDEEIKDEIGGAKVEEKGYELVKEIVGEKLVPDVLLDELEKSYEMSSKTEITENKETYSADINDLKGFHYMDGHQNSSVQQSSGYSQQQNSLSESHNFEDNMQVTFRKMEVPRDKVGVLIGKGGDNIRYLQHNSGAKIQISRESDLNPYSSIREVDIVGNLESISKAEKLIKDVITEAEAGGSPSFVARGGATAHTTFVVEQMQMQVPNEKVGVIIGKGGETIKGLQGKSGARIQVLIPQNFPEGVQSRERIVRVTGDKKQIEMARELINEVMNQPTRPPPSGGYRHQAYRPRPSNPSSQFYPPPSLPPNPTNPSSFPSHNNPYPTPQPPRPTWNQRHPDFYPQQPSSTEPPNFPAPTPNPSMYPPSHPTYPYPNPNPNPNPNPSPSPNPAPNLNYAPSYEDPKYSTQPQMQQRPTQQTPAWYGMPNQTPVMGYGGQQMGYTTAAGYYGHSEAPVGLPYTQQGYAQPVVQQQGYSQPPSAANTQQQFYSLPLTPAPHPAFFQTTTPQQVYSHPVVAAPQQVYSQPVPAAAAQQGYQAVAPGGQGQGQGQAVYMQQGYSQVGSGGPQQCYGQPPQQQVYSQSFIASVPPQIPSQPSLE